MDKLKCHLLLENGIFTNIHNSVQIHASMHMYCTTIRPMPIVAKGEFLKMRNEWQLQWNFCR